jgi:hypothetical protein
MQWIMSTLKVTKKAALKMWERLARDTAVDMKKGTDCNCWLMHELEAVLAWHGVQKMSLMGKQQKIEEWREIQSTNGQPATIERWTDNGQL